MSGLKKYTSIGHKAHYTDEEIALFHHFYNTLQIRHPSDYALKKDQSSIIKSGRSLSNVLTNNNILRFFVEKCFHFPAAMRSASGNHVGMNYGRMKWLAKSHNDASLTIKKPQHAEAAKKLRHTQT